MKRIICLLITLVLTLGLCSCKTAQKKFTTYSFDYFDTVTTIIGYEQSEEVFNKNCEQIKSWLNKYHKLYDIYTLYDGINNLCKINMTNNGKAQKVEPEIIDLLEYSKELYKTTNKKLNIAMGSVLSIWHDHRDYGLKNPQKATLPHLKDLNKANKHTNIEKIIIDKQNNTICITDKDLKLDVGGIAKGYATQKVAEKMIKAGMDDYLLNVGGNVKIVGKRPNGQTWKIGIENPNTDSSDTVYIEQLELNDNLSLVTSGSYQRFYTVNGKNYHHIIDPDTLSPANYFKSVSVLCENSGLADAYSTALFCMTLEDGKTLVEKTPDMYVMWVLDDGKKIYSNGFENYIIK